MTVGNLEERNFIEIFIDKFESNLKNMTVENFETRNFIENFIEKFY